MRVGIDVGGTNTDAVLLDGSDVLAGVKQPTSPDVTFGIVSALNTLGQQCHFAPDQVSAVMIGTTHFINALIEARRLAPTAALRLGLPATASLPPLVGWPKSLVDALQARTYLAHGGHEFDGRHIAELDPDEIKRQADDMAAHGIRSVAISSVFSPINTEFEKRAAEIVADQLGDQVAISLSHEIGRIGLLERENATIINAALRELAQQITDALIGAVRDYGITAPVYLSQNDGTLMDIDYTRQYPVATFASGPTNSMRGAAALSGLGDCVVIDIGGTTSDIGVLSKGFPREATGEVTVAGVRTNFRMPDVLSIGIGGGSQVQADGRRVGPTSVGYQLTERALVFGGSEFTATDAAVALGYAAVGDPALVAGLDRRAAQAALATVAQAITAAVERMRISAEPLPVVAVGGGSILLPDELPELGQVHRPQHFEVANAIGAAIAQVSGEVDRVYAIPDGQRDRIVEEAKAEAIDKAVAAGASPGAVQVVDFDEVPLPYVPGNATRIRVKAVGELVMEGTR
ncbi:MAG: hydantoinase/oxoprolinase family protein [Propionibacteriaceae bacterium]|jgi:N-methylhydantoinase A/oxoprolinase/acetone carboxylase beta subunit|nr:hydantoinase/oxoprolinase family protein [Propionibacteriaceae bacterium]